MNDLNAREFEFVFGLYIDIIMLLCQSVFLLCSIIVEWTRFQIKSHPVVVTACILVRLFPLLSFPLGIIIIIITLLFSSFMEGTIV